MIQIPRRSSEPIDNNSTLKTAFREFKKETKCKNKNIVMCKESVIITWKDCGIQWSYQIYIGKIQNDFEFESVKHNFKDCIINVSKSNTRYRCKIDVNTLNNPWSETLIIMNINDYYRFMIYEKLENYNEYSIVYKKSLNQIMFLSNRKPGIEVNI